MLFINRPVKTKQNCQQQNSTFNNHHKHLTYVAAHHQEHGAKEPLVKRPQELDRLVDVVFFVVQHTHVRLFDAE